MRDKTAMQAADIMMLNTCDAHVRSSVHNADRPETPSVAAAAFALDVICYSRIDRFTNDWIVIEVS